MSAGARVRQAAALGVALLIGVVVGRFWAWARQFDHASVGPAKLLAHQPGSSRIGVPVSGWPVTQAAAVRTASAVNVSVLACARGVCHHLFPRDVSIQVVQTEFPQLAHPPHGLLTFRLECGSTATKNIEEESGTTFAEVEIPATATMVVRIDDIVNYTGLHWTVQETVGRVSALRCRS